MNIEAAISQACADVGIAPPKTWHHGRWAKTNTLSGKSGKGDGRLMVNEAFVTAWNWQTGEKSTVGLKDKLEAKDRHEIAKKIEEERELKKRRAGEAAKVAAAIIAKARPAQHAYLVAKGFQHERALVCDAQTIRAIGGKYLVPETGRAAIVIPAKIGPNVTSLQIIWESGDKKFLAGGAIDGASHRIATGSETWLCEGFATGLALRLALKGLGRRPTVLCCFSAYNVFAVARATRGKLIIATDNDKPLEQFGGLGTGEYYARQAERPFVMPPTVGTDFDDLYMAEGIFAVQRVLADFAKGARM